MSYNQVSFSYKLIISYKILTVWHDVHILSMVQNVLLDSKLLRFVGFQLDCYIPMLYHYNFTTLQSSYLMSKHLFMGLFVPCQKQLLIFRLWTVCVCGPSWWWQISATWHGSKLGCMLGHAQSSFHMNLFLEL